MSILGKLEIIPNKMKFKSYLEIENIGKIQVRGCSTLALRETKEYIKTCLYEEDKYFIEKISSFKELEIRIFSFKTLEPDYLILDFKCSAEIISFEEFNGDICINWLIKEKLYFINNYSGSAKGPANSQDC